MEVAAAAAAGTRQVGQFLNMPLNMSGNEEQLPVDGWGGGNSGGEHLIGKKRLGNVR